MSCGYSFVSRQALGVDEINKGKRKKKGTINNETNWSESLILLS
jgi:hypothetical protein